MTETGATQSKLVTVFGTPSGYTHFCLSVMHRLLHATIKAFDHAAASEIEQLRTAWSVRRHSSLLLFSDIPERAIVQTYLRTRAPVVIFLEDPEDVARYMVLERGLSLTWAVRVAEQSLTTMSDLFCCDHALIIPREKRWTLSDFLVSTANHFGLPLTDADLQTVAREISPHDERVLGATMDDLYRQHWPKVHDDQSSSLGPRAFHAFEPIFARLRQIAEGRAVQEIAWPVFMFIASHKPDAAFDGAVDLVGPARCVVYGPFMCLPRGDWGLTADLTVTENASGNELEVDVFQSDVLSRNRFPLPADGDFQLRARFEIRESRIPVQLRLMITQGAIEGKIELRSVRLAPLNPASE